jgi:hypothetical protein
MVKGKKSDAVPIVCMHPMSGLSGAWNVFCREFGPDHDIYCLENPHYTGTDVYQSSGAIGKMYTDAILDAVGDRKWIFGSYSGGIVYSIEVLLQMRMKNRYPSYFFTVDGFGMSSPGQIGNLCWRGFPFPCCCCAVISPFCCQPICGPCCSKISKSNTKKWDTTKPPVSMNMERDSRKDNKNFKADLEHVWNMYDFYRVGYPRDSPCLLDPHPGPAKLLRGDKMFNDAVDDLNTYAGGKYGDLWDTDKHRKMQDVSFHNTMNFFMKHAMFKPHSHGDLPVGGYPVYNQSSGFADPGGLDLYLKFMSSNIVDYTPIDFTVRDEYKNIFNRGPFKGWLMPHNTCMMHEEFVSQLVKSVKGTMGKLELL